MKVVGLYQQENLWNLWKYSQKFKIYAPLSKAVQGTGFETSPGQLWPPGFMFDTPALNGPGVSIYPSFLIVI